MSSGGTLTTNRNQTSSCPFLFCFRTPVLDPRSIHRTHAANRPADRPAGQRAAKSAIRDVRQKPRAAAAKLTRPSKVSRSASILFSSLIKNLTHRSCFLLLLLAYFILYSFLLLRRLRLLSRRPHSLVLTSLSCRFTLLFALLPSLQLSFYFTIFFLSVKHFVL